MKQFSILLRATTAEGGSRNALESAALAAKEKVKDKRTEKEKER